MVQISVDPHVSLINIFEAGIKVSLGLGILGYILGLCIDEDIFLKNWSGMIWTTVCLTMIFGQWHKQHNEHQLMWQLVLVLPHS